MFKQRRDEVKISENGHDENKRLISSSSGSGQRRVESYSSINSVNEGQQMLNAGREGADHQTMVVNSENFKKKRLIDKNGDLNVRTRNVHRKHELYFTDLFTTLTDLPWSRFCLIFCAVYIFSWTFFASLYLLINSVRSENDYCIEQVSTWTEAFLFSLETQMTIGYGGRQITPGCPDGIIILQLQSILSMAEDAFLIGLMFCKLSKPQTRASTVKFSQNACIALRNGKMCFMFRLADIRKSQLLEAHVRLQLFHHSQTKEGYECDFFQEDLKVGYDWRHHRIDDDENRNQIFVLLPMIIIHVIDETSPLYDISPEQLMNSDFEFVAIMDGIVESTGMNTQPRTSYLADEVLWGRDFKNLIYKSYHDGESYWVDFADFDSTFEVPCPDVSPREFYKTQKEKGLDTDDDSNGSSDSEFTGTRDERVLERPVGNNYLHVTKL